MGISQKSIKEIKELMESVDPGEYPSWIETLSLDERAGVRQIANTLEHRIKSARLEADRLLEMKKMEENFRTHGFRLVGGMDEVGRGPLAGPVVSCAILLPEDSMVEKVNDSKKLNETTREKLYETLLKNALSVGIGLVENTEIDRINILQATKKSMHLALDQMERKPDLILVDAMELKGLDLEQRAIIKGDARCYSIAAASIVAKVHRDRIMEAYHEIYPMYHFDSNKGYGTKEHVEAIQKYGLSPIHRRSFCTNFL
ncbi:ribonuclease HII [Alkalibacter rhizosphaerae]|uniref:Ribonuclease HII n=1 Tax=Alkalibacter rhizosphaerae TaxID=2815577 RepID=A0A974XH97_9FIRM|nr:ribonuclease HII [Alkalibacter rhizosphaerae]QSX08715.1 ribonuclease HII [Alkalibacter rhizosphaerae]